MTKIPGISCLLVIAALFINAREVLAAEQPYKNIAQAIPGTVQAADYDTGGPGAGYSVPSVNGTANWYRQDGVNLQECADLGGYNLGWGEPGDWFRYTVSVQAAGKYVVGFRVASGAGGGSLHIADEAGRNLSGRVAVPGTGGWHNWTTVYAAVELPSGLQTLTLFEETAGYNIHYMIFEPSYRVPPSPTGLVARAGDRNVTLMWTPTADAISYTVYRRPSATGAGARAIATGVAAPRYTDTSAARGIRYAYSVTAATFDKTSAKSEPVEALVRTVPTVDIPDFGPNVLIFDPKMPAVTIQSQVDAVFQRQQANEFGTDRYAFLFQPGNYNATVRVGFYTQVLGLGASPDDTSITGAVQTDAAWMGGNATINFWRGAENLSITPGDGTAVWAVSQACPMRRTHIHGSLRLHDHYGWSSGGFLSDSLIDGQVDSGTQQQWITRDSHIGSWKGSNWNMVFVGVENAPPPSFPRPPYAVVDRAPIVREKPFLTIDANGRYSVFVPSLRSESHGTTWASAPAKGKFLPISRFYIAHPGEDTAETMNAALASGKNLLLTPGIYRLNDTLRIARPGTVVLGLGLATIEPEGGVDAMDVADVDGVIVAGILFDAGSASSAALLQIGEPGCTASHASNPTSLSDLFFRVGGAGAGRAAVSLKINSNDVIGDDLWIWRADHGDGVGWNVNTAENGLVVNGADVTIYGLAVEHYQGYQTLWNGNGGRVYFYQSEAPYDVPDQGAWMDGSADGFASYKVANSVSRHEVWGLGVYCVFDNPAVTLGSAIEAPATPGVILHDMTTVSLGGGRGTIAHVINGAGNPARRGASTQTLAQYP